MALLLCICSCQYKQRNSSDNIAKERVDNRMQLISTTPIKNQGNNSLCWAYACHPGE